MSIRPKLVAALCGTALLAVAAAPTAMASDGNSVAKITIRDRCDPATFPVPCAAHGGGVVTFDRFANFLLTHQTQVFKEENALGWRFTPDKTEVKVGGVLDVHNVGGELHTFTEVTGSGFQNQGCVDAVNGLLGLPGVNPLCAKLPHNNALGLPDDLVPPGATIHVSENDRGVELYQCMIHPWMRTTVEVKR
jgi:plastocyanin